MGQLVLSVAIVLACGLLAVFSTPGAAAETKQARAKTGIEKRTPWTTSRVVGSPDPPSPYRTEVALPALAFDEPLDMARIPDTNLLVIGERHGKIFAFVDDPKAASKELLVDLRRELRGMAFHPKFAENGYLYVAAVISDSVSDSVSDGDQENRHMRLSRFRRSSRDPLRVDPKTELTMLTWPAEGHTGGCIRFGPDGYLYVAIGDGSGIADQLKTGQDVSDLLASILRIDVDRRDGKRAYAIPKDNPFVGLKGARPEIWAYGLRQAWRFDFDPKTGDLWAGEVGQDLWEMVYLIRRGGNYGWSVSEGGHPFRPERKQGPTAILPPVVFHAHAEARSVTGGYVYRGKRLKDLRGEYVYGDYDTGKIWSLRWDGKAVTRRRELVDTQLRIVSIGQDRSGEVYFVDHMGGHLHRLATAPPAKTSAPRFPRKLSQTGLFASTKDHRPAAGLIPYSVNAALWSDAAVKERFIALPGTSQIELDTVVYPQPAPGASPGWRFPDNTVLVKTFSLEMEQGNPASRRRLETRLLHFKHMPGTDEIGAQFWRGYTYVWNDEQTDAELLKTEGLDRTYTIKDADVPGGVRKQTWRFPSRAECTLCHTMSAKYALGVNTLQMNKDHDYDGVVANQLSTLEHLGVFTKKLPKPPAEMPRLVDYHDEEHSVEERARSYLHANCAHCHRKWGGGNAEFQLLTPQPLAEAGVLEVRPAHGGFGLDNPRLIVAGDPGRSMIHHRMEKTGLGRMPHIGSNLVDRRAVDLIAKWIKQIPAEKEPVN